MTIYSIPLYYVRIRWTQTIVKNYQPSLIRSIWQGRFSRIVLYHPSKTYLSCRLAKRP